MAASKKRLNEKDLAWFDIARYDGDRLMALGLQGWLQLLTKRLTIKKGIENGNIDVALSWIRMIGRDPFAQVLGSIPPILPSHPSDTPSVTLARAGTLHMIGQDIEQLGLGMFEVYDECKRAPGDSKSRPVVTINVNLMASRTQIKKDFARWLVAMDAFHPAPTTRVYSNANATFPEWIEGKYLPCFDLHLYAEALASEIPSELLAVKLGLDNTEKSVQDLLRTPLKSKTVFSTDTLMDMWLQLSQHATPPVAPQHAGKEQHLAHDEPESLGRPASWLDVLKPH